MKIIITQFRSIISLTLDPQYGPKWVEGGINWIKSWARKSFYQKLIVFSPTFFLPTHLPLDVRLLSPNARWPRWAAEKLETLRSWKHVRICHTAGLLFPRCAHAYVSLVDRVAEHVHACISSSSTSLEHVKYAKPSLLWVWSSWGVLGRNKLKPIP